MFRRILFLLVPLAILASTLRLSPQIVFVAAFLSLIPLASLLGEATEVLALHASLDGRLPASRARR
jgi:Ca2+/H+ antiporter